MLWSGNYSEREYTCAARIGLSAQFLIFFCNAWFLLDSLWIPFGFSTSVVFALMWFRGALTSLKTRPRILNKICLWPGSLLRISVCRLCVLIVYTILTRLYNLHFVVTLLPCILPAIVGFHSVHCLYHSLSVGNVHFHRNFRPNGRVFLPKPSDLMLSGLYSMNGEPSGGISTFLTTLRCSSHRNHVSPMLHVTLSCGF